MEAGGKNQYQYMYVLLDINYLLSPAIAAPKLRSAQPATHYFGTAFTYCPTTGALAFDISRLTDN